MLEFHKFGSSCLDCFIRIYKNQVWLTSSKWSLLVHAADVLWVGDEGKVRPLLRAIVSLMVEKIVQKKRLGQVLHILQLKKRRIMSKSKASSCRESPYWGWLWLMVSKMGKERLEWLAGKKLVGNLSSAEITGRATRLSRFLFQDNQTDKVIAFEQALLQIGELSILSGGPTKTIQTKRGLEHQEHMVNEHLTESDTVFHNLTRPDNLTRGYPDHPTGLTDRACCDDSRRPDQ